MYIVINQTFELEQEAVAYACELVNSSEYTEVAIIKDGSVSSIISKSHVI